MNQKPFIQNISRRDCIDGVHAPINHDKDVLISINDPSAEAPIPKHTFASVHRFFFDDIEQENGPHGEVGILQGQALAIARILQDALQHGANVIVHCHAGLCRSGAVAEVGEAMGFSPGGRRKVPNMRVKNMILQELGMAFDPERSAFSGLRKMALLLDTPEMESPEFQAHLHDEATIKLREDGCTELDFDRAHDDLLEDEVWVYQVWYRWAKNNLGGEY